MVLSATEPENICERVREPANWNPHPGPFPSPTSNATLATPVVATTCTEDDMSELDFF